MFILSSRAHVLELPEPLWVRFLPINVWLGAAWRISGFARLRNRKARTYAIENNDPAVVIFGSRAPLKVVKNVGLLAVGLLFRSLYEKVAFGTLCLLMLEGRPLAEIEETARFCRSIGLPTTLADLDLADAGPDEIGRVAEAALKPGAIIGRVATPLSPAIVRDAILALDAYTSGLSRAA